MAFNVLQLLVKAYNAAGVNPSGFKNLTPEQTQNGLFLLNCLLSDKTVDTSMLLYWKKLDGTFVAGQKEYFIERLISIETLTYFLSDGNVRMPTQAQNIDQFMGSCRVEDVQSLPFTYFVNQSLGGSDLYVYYPPNEAYPYQIWGQFQLESVTLLEDLEENFPLFYIRFLILQLANEICIDQNMDTPIGVLRKLAKYQETISLNGTVQDMGCQLTSTVSTSSYPDWIQINIDPANTPGWNP